MTTFPSRIVCLTEETTETLYLLGEGDRVVGVSGYTVRPREAREKPRVSAFISAKFDRILSLAPDLVLAFSDLQADLAAELIRRGVAVFTFNQRSVDEILQMIRIVAGIVGCEGKGAALVARLEGELDDASNRRPGFPRRPRVFFEEWDEPLISGIRWVEELVEIAGGDPIFPELRNAALAKQRFVDADEVRRRQPEVVIGSWCGKAVKKRDDRVASGLDRCPCHQGWPCLRDQVHLHPAAGPRLADRRRAAAARDPGARGRTGSGCLARSPRARRSRRPEGRLKAGRCRG